MGWLSRKQKDPVCGRTGDDAHAAEYNGRTYRFCSAACRSAFERTPERYARKRGRLGRFLDRLAAAGEEARRQSECRA